MNITFSPLAHPEPRRGGGRTRLARGLYLLVLLAILAATLYYFWWQSDRRASRYDGIIREAATRHRLSPFLIKAVIRQESNFRPGVTGNAGEIGLMQITAPVIQDWERITGQRCGSRGMLYEPRLNIEIGTWCLARAWNHWPGRADRESLALAQYNAGRTHALRWARVAGESDVLANISFPSTRQYISNVLRYKNKYAHGAQARE